MGSLIFLLKKCFYGTPYGHSMVVIVSFTIMFGLLNVGTASIEYSNMAVCIVQYGDWYANSSN